MRSESPQFGDKRLWPLTDLEVSLSASVTFAYEVPLARETKVAHSWRATNSELRLMEDGSESEEGMKPSIGITEGVKRLVQSFNSERSLPQPIFSVVA